MGSSSLELWLVDSVAFDCTAVTDRPVVICKLVSESTFVESETPSVGSVTSLVKVRATVESDDQKVFALVVNVLLLPLVGSTWTVVSVPELPVVVGGPVVGHL